ARVGPRRVGGGGQDVGQRAGLDDVRRMATAGTFGVIGVDGAAGEGGNRIVDEAALVERVGVNGDLHVVALRHAQAVVDRGRGAAPVLVQLEAAGTGLELLLEGARQAGVALAQEAEVHGQLIRGLQHAVQVPDARRAGGGVGARGRSGAATYHG